MEFTLMGAVFVAIVPLYGVIYWEAKRGNAASCSKDLWDVAITAALVGLLVGRIAAMISSGVNPLTNPADLLIVRGGVATGPAATGAIMTAAWLGRRELLPVLDGLAAASLASLAGWHAGCLVRDACLGTPSDLPWAIAQPGSSITRHPVELYAAALLAVAAILVARWRRKGRPAAGLPATVALFTASMARLLTEPMRPNLEGGPIGWYVVGLLVAGRASIWLIRQRHEPQRVRNLTPD